MNRIAILGTGGGYDGKAEVPEPIAEIVAEGFEPGLIPIRLGVFPGTPEHREINVLEYLEAGYRAALAADPGSRFHGLLLAGMEEVLG